MCIIWVCGFAMMWIVCHDTHVLCDECVVLMCFVLIFWCCMNCGHILLNVFGL